MSDFYHDYYSALNGARIIKFVGMRDDDFGARNFPVFEVVTKAGLSLEIEISRDEEGNGGGFIFGLPVPENKGGVNV